MKCEYCDKDATIKLSFPFRFNFGGYKHSWGSYKYVCLEHERAFDCNDVNIKHYKDLAREER